MRKSAFHHKDETQNPGQDGCLNECVLTLKIMDMCPGKVKKTAPSGCALSTTEILYNKNDPLWSWAEAKIHQHLPQRGCDHFSASVNIKFIVAALRGFVIMPRVRSTNLTFLTFKQRMIVRMLDLFCSCPFSISAS